MFENIFPAELYHSYIIEGDASTLSGALVSYLQKRNLVVSNSSDVLCQDYEAFTIDDSHLIKSWHSEKSANGGHRFCILGMKFINREAEQSLLKVLEEPNHNTHIFIIIPNVEALAETIKSRTHIIKLNKNIDKLELPNELPNQVKEFLKLNSKDRIDMVAKIIKSHDNDEGSGALRFEATELLNGVETILHQKFLEDKTNKEIIFKLEEIAQCRAYLHNPGASVKMILEHIALVV